MENRIRIMVVEPLKKPYFASIKNTKNVYEKIVGGEICDDLLDSKTAIVYNKNAKENELVPNRRVGRDIICGTFFVASEFSDNEYASLSDIQSSYYYREFSEAEVMSQAEVKENLEYAINGIGKDYVYTNNLSMRFYEENTDFVKVSESYKTEDKSAAKELLKIMYEEFVKTYDTDCIDDIMGDGEDFIDIPVVFKSKKLTNVINVVGVDEYGKVNVAVTDGDERLSFYSVEDEVGAADIKLHNGVTNQLWDGRTGIRYIYGKNDSGKITNKLHVFVAPSNEYDISLSTFMDSAATSAPNRFVDIDAEGANVKVTQVDKLFAPGILKDVQTGSSVKINEDGVYSIITNN